MREAVYLGKSQSKLTKSVKWLVTGWTAGVWLPTGKKSLCHHVYTGTVAHLTSCPIVTRVFCLVIKWPECEGINLSQLVQSFKSAMSYISLCHHIFIVWCLIHHLILTFTFKVARVSALHYMGDDICCRWDRLSWTESRLHGILLTN